MTALVTPVSVTVPNRKPFVREPSFVDGVGPCPHGFFDETQDHLGAASHARMGRLWTQVHEEFDAPIYPTGYVGGLSIFRNEPVGGGLGFNPGNPIEPGDHGIWSGLSVLNPYDVILLGNSFGFGGDYLLSVKVRLIGSARLDRLADEALHIGLSNPAGGLPAFAFGSDTPNWQLFMGGIGYVDSGYPLEDNVWYRLQVCRYSGAIFWIINGRPIRFQGLPGYYFPDTQIGYRYLRIKRWNNGPANDGLLLDHFHMGASRAL